MANVNTIGKSTPQLLKEWKEVLESADVPKIEDKYKAVCTARLLENQEQALLTEAPTGLTAGIAKWDPVLISMVRRTVPNMIAFDIFGVQPMSAPTGLVFALRSRYGAQDGAEAMFNEPNSGWSGDRANMTTAGSAPEWDGKGTPDGTLTDPTAANYGHGHGMATASAELLGSTNAWNEMSVSIEKVSVTATSRALKANWSLEMAQDMAAVHGLDAEAEMASILATEVTNEINREMVRRAYTLAQQGCADTTTAGTFDLAVDSDGRWAVERFKGLMIQIEKEANTIAINTRRGKGNFIICSANVASALSMTNLLDNAGLTSVDPGLVDPTGTTYVGVMSGRTKVFVDPYATVDFVLVGYKGASALEAGAFMCPYIPLTAYKATNPNDFTTVLGFKTRYGFVESPFAGAGGVGNNVFYRIFKIVNL